ncbi:hypothetical protein A2316_01750 [Candidatus Falkowbacteria bacterium RIFOXYB2_FULL_38_15]|uniref:Uncharacterized protein n=1 Tax=Candidatus Falkowbacteria bacterium RIFOXYA2_FULL_38_12 TaxID=1797993 RepID=A0A1F5S3G0_9BACT|nr:MAG: hypothetical protein A2257_03530 [Candidatus Falkowbacteria bacterium RIFOXYA2_FULL_38_12]OGF32676.1 MAG: hypothetical protein A2316_01750 [Candidatus Falkowbacteria bacterium RIFOXYB2_FULL_38_15]
MLQEERGGNNWSGKKSLGLGVFLIVGIAIVGFGLWQFNYRIKAPFLGKATGLKNFKSLDQKELETMIEKQKKDTDSDGLTDFDEEYVYKTSAYLDDSDSDGFTDKMEIDSGNDPNCPSGQSCGVAIAVGDDAKTSSGEIVLPSVDTFLDGNATPEMVREALRQSGASEEMLASLDDEALMAAYAEVVKETGSASAVQNLKTETIDETDETVPADTVPPKDEGAVSSEIDLASLTPAQIRELLLQSGMDEATLNSVDDETLLDVLKEAMKEVKE